MPEGSRRGGGLTSLSQMARSLTDSHGCSLALNPLFLPVFRLSRTLPDRHGRSPLSLLISGFGVRVPDAARETGPPPVETLAGGFSGIDEFSGAVTPRVVEFLAS